MSDHYFGEYFRRLHDDIDSLARAVKTHIETSDESADVLSKIGKPARPWYKVIESEPDLDFDERGLS